MKKLFQIILTVLMLTVFTGCEDFLTQNHPTGITDDKFWETETHARDALRIVYDALPGGTNGRDMPLNTSNIMIISGLSDEAVHRADYIGAYEEFTRGVHNSNWSTSLWFWSSDFSGTRRASRFLEHVDKCFMDEALKTRMKYEARALRAYYHMELFQFFGGIPIVTKSLTPNENNVSRNSEEEVYNFIISELTECAQNLPDTYTNDEFWRVNSAACWTLIARLALYKKDFALARDASQKVIDKRIYELYTSKTAGANNLAELFTYSGMLNNERIMIRPSGAAVAWTRFAPFGIGGETYTSPTSTVVDNWETKQGKTIFELGPDSLAAYRKNPNHRNNRDPRLLASVLFSGEKFVDNTYTVDPFNASPNNPDRIGLEKSTATGYWIKKYLDPRDRQPRGGTLDFMIIRYAEVLLNYAEALIELGEWSNPEVLKNINMVRNRSKMPNVDVKVYNSQVKLRELIRRERQAELAFEGQRYYDIRRWGIVNEVMNGQVFGATNPETGVPVRVEERSYNPSRDYLWPIPQNELLANPNMQQNPNY
ncbi:RagB/SusD family nutrient uptake outer membrane protein [Dyadobacter sp. CY327]|uniref:RagB/SusD family nutrient uptake outer membrane protein n=1 Tax=Dyadobacter sp. CY327 TaxID=2907301 RepID=UPI001F23116B|nr:RagB/SusD family nutrient uptake outer membrane protein [Dyadobacter sp. CY327]MCE7071899.1 RagB/SusD family nutrient uptake outer membrane protein [Dyadobacter sp. CY327]